MTFDPSWLQNKWLTLPVLAWSLFWKGKALWKAAKRDQKYWFIGLLVINTVGVLEILYLFYFCRKKEAPAAKSTKLAK